jgi:predicted ATPase/DNA-binding SARP family transcriptional activator
VGGFGLCVACGFGVATRPVITLASGYRACVRFCDLGPLEVEVDGSRVTARGARLNAVLATLLLHLNRRVSTDLLLDAVWGEATTASSHSTLETHIWRLRRLLEPTRGRGQAASVLINDAGGYRLLAQPEDVDSARFEQLGLEVLDLGTTQQSDRALQAAEQALGLWRGSPFEPIADRAWAAGPIARLDEIRAQLQERRIDAILGVDRPELAVRELEPLLADQPYRERLWWLRMLALHRAGRSEDALATFRSARRTLIDEVGIDPGAELVELHRQILDQDPALRPQPARPAPAPARTVEIHLPRARPVVGRAGELAQVASALGRSPLVTVVGGAGSGKTLLASAAARAAATGYPDGVRFVDLSVVEPTADVAAEIVAAVEIAMPETATPQSVLAAYGTDRRVLLILDNCEQVLDQVAEVAELLTEPGRQVRLLATSREPLGIDAEAVITLGPLPVASDGGDGVGPAVALFLDRARLDPATVSVTDLTTIRRICGAVDGIPLAIELAAALTAAYTLTEIVDQVERDPGQLAAIGRGQARHHQTLAAAIDRSHRLLSAEERLLHRRVAVLPGTFGRGLAEAVAGPDLRRHVPGLLAKLVHRSMLSVSHEDGGQARFSQLAPVRGHAYRSLRAAGEVELAEDLRDDWCLALAQSRPRLGRIEEAAWYAEIDANLPIVRATLQRRLVVRPDAVGTAINSQLNGFWFYRDQIEEGIRWAEPALAVTGAGDLDLVLNQLSLGLLLLQQFRGDRGREVIDEALAALATLDLDPTTRTLSERLHLGELLLAVSTGFSGDRDAVKMHQLIDVFETIEGLGDRPDLAVGVEALRCLADTVSDPAGTDLVRVQDIFDRALTLGNLWAGWFSAASGATLGLLRQDPALGMVWSSRVVTLQARLGAKTALPQVETLGDFLALDRRWVEAVRIFSATHHQARRVGKPWPRNPLTSELLDRCRVTLSTEQFERAWAIGPTLSRAQLTVDALP